MKLLFIFKAFGKGGIASVMIEKLNYLVEHGFEIHILTEFANDQLTQQKLRPKIHIHQLPIEANVTKKRLPILGYFQLHKEVKTQYQKFINDLQPDVITGFHFGYNSQILPYIKTKAMKVLELHGSYYSGKNLKKKKDWIDYFKPKSEKLHNFYDAAVLITKEDLKDRTYLSIKKQCIYNSIRLPKAVSDFQSRENIILAVGTLTHNKNFLDLVLAAKSIKNNLKNWQIHIYGEGEEKQLLEQKIKEYQLESIVYLKGFAYDMPKIYNNAKLLISTSLSEGMPRNLLEAKAYKIPVIAYNCKCGPKEIITNGLNGFLIDFKVEELASRILEFTSNPEKLNTFSQHTWDDIQKFEFEYIMQNWIEFYNSLNHAQ